MIIIRVEIAKRFTCSHDAACPRSIEQYYYNNSDHGGHVARSSTKLNRGSTQDAAAGRNARRAVIVPAHFEMQNASIARCSVRFCRGKVPYGIDCTCLYVIQYHIITCIERRHTPAGRRLITSNIVRTQHYCTVRSSSTVLRDNVIAWATSTTRRIQRTG